VDEPELHAPDLSLGSYAVWEPFLALQRAPCDRVAESPRGHACLELANEPASRVVATSRQNEISEPILQIAAHLGCRPQVANDLKRLFDGLPLAGKP
jgi:hypothetical protein